MAATTTKKKAAPKKTEPAPKAEFKLRLPEGVVSIQKRVLEGQHSLFETTYKAINAFQESQEDALHSWLDNSKIVPEQMRELAEVWTKTNRKARESYKDTVDQTFALMEDWVEGLAAQREARAEA